MVADKNRGKKRSPEQLRTLSLAHLGISPSNKGIPLSEEQKRLLRENMPQSLRVVDSDGTVYGSIKHAAKVHGVSPRTIRDSILKKRPVVKLRRVFAFLSEEPDLGELKSLDLQPRPGRSEQSKRNSSLAQLNSTKKKVTQIVDNFGEVYPSAEGAARILGIPSSTVWSALLKGRVSKNAGNRSFRRLTQAPSEPTKK